MGQFETVFFAGRVAFGQSSEPQRLAQENSDLRRDSETLKTRIARLEAAAANQ